jgi:hypothetical protein
MIIAPGERSAARGIPPARAPPPMNSEFMGGGKGGGFSPQPAFPLATRVAMLTAVFAEFHGRQLIHSGTSPQSDLLACWHITPRECPQSRGHLAVSHLHSPSGPTFHSARTGWRVSRISSLPSSTRGFQPFPSTSAGFQPCLPFCRRALRSTADGIDTADRVRTVSCKTGSAGALTFLS